MEKEGQSTSGSTTLTKLTGKPPHSEVRTNAVLPTVSFQTILSGDGCLGLDEKPCNKLAFVWYYKVIPHTMRSVDGVHKMLECVRLWWMDSKHSREEAGKMYGLVSTHSIAGVVNILQIDRELTLLHPSVGFATL